MKARRRKEERGAAAAGQRGLSLLEAIIGVTILGIAASILLVNLRTSVAGQSRSKVYGDAATATKEVLEDIVLMTLDSISRLDGTPMDHSQGPSVDVRASARRIRPADVADFAELDTVTLRHVTLRTRFRSVAGDTVTKTFTTIVYRP